MPIKRQMSYEGYTVFFGVPTVREQEDAARDKRLMTTWDMVTSIISDSGEAVDKLDIGIDTQAGLIAEIDEVVYGKNPLFKKFMAASDNTLDSLIQLVGESQERNLPTSTTSPMTERETSQ